MPDIDILIKAQDRASGPIKSVDNALDNLNKNAGNVAAKGIGQLRNALGVGIKVAAGAAVVAIGALSVALGASFKAAVDMEQAVADIMAVMGKAAPPVEELSQAIQGLGLDPKLKVSAFEAADAIEMLAKNGITWQQIQDGMARSTILLANATNDDFSLAATVATDAMVQFNKDASEMADVVDGIIGVTQQSKFDINDYALALGMAGGVAGSVGVEFEDFNAMLAATSSSFSGGSDAGTSFKVFLQQLIPDTNKSADAMRKLGLFSGLTGVEFDKLQGKISDTQQKIADLDPTSATYSERLSELNAKLAEQRGELMAGGSAFFDANGNMKSAEEITGALAEAFTGLSDKQRIEAASTIFGTDAMRTALALADAGEDTVHKFKLAIGDTSAEDAAATRMDTLRGAWEIFMGVTQTLSIQLGQVFLPVARDVVEWATQLATTHGPAVIAWATSFSNVLVPLIKYIGTVVTSGDYLNDWITHLPEGIKPVVRGFGEFIAHAIDLAKYIGAVVESGDYLNDWITHLPEGIKPVVRGFGEFIVGIQGVIDWVGKTIGPFVSWKDVLNGLAVVVTTVVVTAIGGFLAAMAPVAIVVGGAIAAVALMRNAWERDWGGIQGKVQTAMDYISGRFGPLGTTIKTFGTDALKEITAWANGTETKFTATTAIWNEFRDTVVAVGNDIKAAFFGTGGAGTKMGLWLRTEFPAASAASVFASNELKAAFTNLATATGTSFGLTKNQADSFMMALQDVIGKSLAVIITRMTTFVANFGDLMKLMDRANQRDWKGMWDAIQSVQDRATRTQLFDAAVWAGEMELAMQIAGADTAKGYASGIDGSGHLGEAAMSTFDARVKQQMFDDFGIRSPSTVFKGYGVDTIQGFINGIGGMIGAVGSKMGEIVSAIKGSFGDSINWLLSAGQNVVQGFINGIGNMIGAAQTKVTELATLAAQAATAALGIGSPSKVFVGIGRNVGASFGLGIEQSMGKLSPTFNNLNTWVPSMPASNSTSINNSRSTSNQMIVQVQSTGDGVRDIRNQVELYALTFGAT